MQAPFYSTVRIISWIYPQISDQDGSDWQWQNTLAYYNTESIPVLKCVKYRPLDDLIVSHMVEVIDSDKHTCLQGYILIYGSKMFYCVALWYNFLTNGGKHTHYVTDLFIYIKCFNVLLNDIKV